MADPRDHDPRRRRLLAAAGIVTIVVALDQLSKQWAFTSLRDGGRRVLIDGVLELKFAFNTGAAFSAFADAGGARPVFVGITIAALIYMAWMFRRLPTETGIGGPIGLALMAGGALGNLIDRLVRVHEVQVSWHESMPFWALIDHPREVGDAILRGRPFAMVPRHGVVDFIVVHYGGDRTWPSFNVADACLVVGVGLLLVYLLRWGRALTPETAHRPDRPSQ